MDDQPKMYEQNELNPTVPAQISIEEQIAKARKNSLSITKQRIPINTVKS
jgi:hypothetical protein